MKHLYFVRHGLSEMNKKGLFSGRTETPLATEGIEQSRTSGRELSKAGIDCIVTSPMKRTVDTANIIAAEIGFDPKAILVSELFMERDLGPLEGQPYVPDMDFATVAGVESDTAILKRGRQALDYLEMLPHDNVLVISHGALGRALRHVVHPDQPFHGSDRFENGQVVQLL